MFDTIRKIHKEIDCKTVFIENADSSGAEIVLDNIAKDQGSKVMRKLTTMYHS